MQYNLRYQPGRVAVSDEDRDIALATAEETIEKYLKEKKGRADWQDVTLTPDKNTDARKYNAVQHYEEMSVHIEGTYPERIIGERRPNEPGNIHEYRKNNYRCMTKGAITEAIDSLHRIFVPGEYRVEVSDERLNQYIHGPNFNEDTYVGYIQQYIIKQMLLDPNAWLVCYPTGQGVKDSTQRVEMGLLIVDSIMQMVYYPEYAISWYSHNKSKVSIGTSNTKKPVGAIFYIFTENTYYILSQEEEYTNNAYVLEAVYAYDTNRVPAVSLGGEYNRSKGIYESFFNAFLPAGNEALAQYSDWQASQVTCSYPVRVVKWVECTYPKCYDGYLEGDPEQTCPKCNGVGQIEPSSPYGTYRREDTNTAFKEGPVDNTPPIEYISPDTAILDYAEKAWRSLIDDAKNALHLVNSHSGEAAESRKIDREREYAAISKISNHVYGHIIRPVLQFMVNYIPANDGITTTVIAPTEFFIKDENDLLEDFKLLKEQGAPVAVIKEVMRNLMKVKFAVSDEVKWVNTTLLTYDVLMPYTLEEKLKMLAGEMSTAYEVFTSIYAPNELERLMDEGDVEPLITPYDVVDEKLTKALEERYTKLETTEEKLELAVQAAIERRIALDEAEGGQESDNFDELG